MNEKLWRSMVDPNAATSRNRDIRWSGGICANEISAREDWLHSVAAFLNIFSAAFFSIHQNEQLSFIARHCSPDASQIVEQDLLIAQRGPIIQPASAQSEAAPERGRRGMKEQG